MSRLAVDQGFVSDVSTVKSLGLSLPRRLNGPNRWGTEQFAQTQMSYVLVRILQHFGSIESRDVRPLKETFGTTMASGNGTIVSLVRREETKN